VGAQLRPAQELRQLVASACSGPAPAGALLMVSGSHPFRSLPLVRGLLQHDSTWLLQQASAMRATGEVPGGTQLWAVGNPVMEPGAARLERKVAAGAQVVLTQPPLDWPAFERWMRDAEARGLASAARLLIGVPMLTSAANAAFWLGLCGAYSNAAARQLVQEFRRREAQLTADQFDLWTLAWNEDLVRRVLAVPGVAGLHVMPITAKGRKQAAQLQQEGAMPASRPFR
jgi:5,10-methylenetetrahydrofolate reductase